jgi:hypothetical protein
MNIWIKTSIAVASLWMLTAAPSTLRIANGATPDSVYNWNEVPQNQDVPITSAVFDRGGYQLHDTAGETIVVPYKPNSLCALKFARSNTGSMYLVNEGCSPVLYVPPHGDLKDADVPNARWSPFSQGYDPTHPVYMAVAPSLQSYNNMGWYPGMDAEGGYESDNDDGGPSFGTDIGLTFVIGGQDYDGWSPYQAYYGRHPTQYRMAYYDQPVYGWAGRPMAGRSFVGDRRMWAHRSVAGDRQFRAVAVVSIAGMVHNARIMHNVRLMHDNRMMHDERLMHNDREMHNVSMMHDERMMHNDREMHNVSMMHNERMMHNDRMALRAKTFRPIDRQAERAKAMRTVAHASGPRTMRTAIHSTRAATVRTMAHRSSNERDTRTAGRAVDRTSHTQSFRGAGRPSGGQRRSGGGQRQASFGGQHRDSGGRQSGGGGHQSSFGGGRPSGGGGHQASFGGHQSGGGGHPSGGGGGHPSGASRDRHPS